MATNAPEPIQVTRTGDQVFARFAKLTNLNEYHADQVGKQLLALGPLAYDGLQLEIAADSSLVLAPTAGLPASRVAGLAVFDSAEQWHAFYGASGRGSVLGIGNFDGIHLGHQAILNQAVELAAKTGAVATALTFEPSPLKVLRPESAPKRISTAEQRLAWFRAVDVESAEIARTRHDHKIERVARPAISRNRLFARPPTHARAPVPRPAGR